MSISVFDNEVSVDMSHLLTRTSTALGFGSPQPAAKPEPVAAPEPAEAPAPPVRKHTVVSLSDYQGERARKSLVKDHHHHEHQRRPSGRFLVLD